MLARLLGRHLGDYRKDNEVALVIEPALGLLEKNWFPAVTQVNAHGLL
jgi:hypothetical protein